MNRATVLGGMKLGDWGTQGYWGVGGHRDRYWGALSLGIGVHGGGGLGYALGLSIWSQGDWGAQSQEAGVRTAWALGCGELGYTLTQGIGVHRARGTRVQ